MFNTKDIEIVKKHHDKLVLRLQVNSVILFVGFLIVNFWIRLIDPHLLLAPILGSVIFIFLKIKFDKVKVWQIYLITIFLTFLFDWIEPIINKGVFTFTPLSTIANLPIIIYFLALEISLEKSVEEVESELEEVEKNYEQDIRKLNDLESKIYF
jgi:MFS superfamily sulfate permease-like transporter